MQATIKTLLGGRIPAPLREIPEPPAELRVRGTVPAESPVAVVGTRKPTTYGRRTVAVIAARLAAAGVPVVSGLAFGIDTEAHRAALDAGGRTVAILPGGLDGHSISPRTNLRLAERIIQSGGALVSEYPEGTTAHKHHYVARNRLISGWARAVVVVEAAYPSGSLITANHAAVQGRDVWAVPGPIDSEASAGTNKLIADGAHPLVNVDQFLDALGVAKRRIEHPLLDFLSQSRHLEEIAAALGREAPELEVELTTLELRGVVKHLGGRYYARP